MALPVATSLPLTCTAPAAGASPNDVNLAASYSQTTELNFEVPSGNRRLWNAIGQKRLGRTAPYRDDRNVGE